MFKICVSLIQVRELVGRISCSDGCVKLVSIIKHYMSTQSLIIRVSYHVSQQLTNPKDKTEIKQHCVKDKIRSTGES